MSYEAWNEDDSSAPDGYVSQDEADEQADDAFINGAQACREMLARFVEQGGNAITAASIRANWHPGWGPDPGRPDDIAVTGKCWCRETYPQLIPGQVSHGPGCCHRTVVDPTPRCSKCNWPLATTLADGCTANVCRRTR